MKVKHLFKLNIFKEHQQEGRGRNLAKVTFLFLATTGKCTVTIYQHVHPKKPKVLSIKVSKKKNITF